MTSFTENQHPFFKTERSAGCPVQDPLGRGFFSSVEYSVRGGYSCAAEACSAHRRKAVSCDRQNSHPSRAWMGTLESNTYGMGRAIRPVVKIGLPRNFVTVVVGEGAASCLELDAQLRPEIPDLPSGLHYPVSRSDH